MAPKKKDEKAAKGDAKGKGKKGIKAMLAEIQPGERPPVQWTFLVLTAGLIIIALYTSYMCFVQRRKTLPIRTSLRQMRTAVVKEYDNLKHSDIKIILETIKDEAESIIAVEKRISVIEFKIKEALALFRNDWVQGIEGLFYFSNYEYFSPDCSTNCAQLNASVVIIDRKEKEIFLEKFLESRRGCYWIGAGLAANSLWYHANEEYLSLGFWGTIAEPNARCACLMIPCSTDYHCWAKVLCNSLRRCMCERKADSIVTL